MRKVKAKIANDNETLRALLLLAIQDPNFDTVRDEILKSPNKSIEDLLTDLRERDSSLAIRDSYHNEISGDGLSYSRRSVAFEKGSKYSKNANTDGKKEWKIPFFPHGWKEAIGQKIFNHMISWRMESNKGHTQQELNNEFDLKVEKMNNNQRGNKRTSRKTTVQENSGDEKEEENEDDKPQKRARIRLAKSNDILTEKNM